MSESSTENPLKKETSTENGLTEHETELLKIILKPVEIVRF
jgi:hypothetical protein